MILLEWLNSSWFNGWWIIFWFFLFAGFVFIVAKILTSTLESLTNKIKVSKIFMGGIVMSLITSFPELVGSIYGVMDNNPLFSIYNETGSNVIQIFLLSSTMLVFFWIWFFKNKKNKKTKTIADIYQQSLLNIDKENKVLIIMLVSFYAIFTLFTSIPQVGEHLYITGWNISIISIVPFALWIAFMIWTLCRKNTTVNTSSSNSVFDKLNIWTLWLLFFIFAIGLIWFSYANSGIVDKMSEVFNIPTQSVASVLLSIPSALPETLTMIFLFKNKQYGLGFSTLVGSGLTNSSFMFYVDSMYRQPIFKEFHTDYLSSNNSDVAISAARMQYWIPLVLVIYLLLFISTRKKVASSNVGATIDLSLITLVYIIGFSLITALVL